MVKNMFNILVKKRIKNKIDFYFFSSILFCSFSFLIFSMGFFIKSAGEKELIKNQEATKEFYKKLEFNIRDKAGSVIESNGIDPLGYKTILRIIGNLPYSEVKEYRCSKNIIEIKTDTAVGNVDFIKKQIPYADVVQDINNNYIIQLFF